LAIAFWILLAFGKVELFGFDWGPIALLIVTIVGALLVVARGHTAGWSPSVVVFVTIALLSTIEGIFAVEYLSLSIRSPDTFSEHLTRASAAYFTIGTATTTGFGDIHASADSSRLIVTAQMIASFAVIVAGLGTALQRAITPKSTGPKNN
jgi:hypothetical protein